MSKPYTVYSYAQGPNVSKSLIVAEYGGIRDQIDYPEFKMGVDNKTPEFLKMNPTGQVPVLKTPEGTLFESNAMAMYFARKVGKGLLGANDLEFARIIQWIDFYNNHIYKPLGDWWYPYMGWVPFEAAKEEKSKESLKGAKGKDPLGILDRHLAASKYLVGNQVTVADIIVFVGLTPLFTSVGAPEYVADLPHLIAWGKTLAATPEFKKGNYNKDYVFATAAPTLPAKKD